MLESYAWNVGSEQGTYDYRLQSNQVDFKSKTKLERVMLENGWKLSCEGFHENSDKMILIFAKVFPNNSKWVQWAKQFPYALKELGKNGEEKKYVKVGIKIKNKKEKNIKKIKKNKIEKIIRPESLKYRRICKKCGILGHTAKKCPKS
jgi:hypothetical protein